VQRQSVESSQVKSVGHDPEQNHLHVEFHGFGGRKPSVYRYTDVPADVHKAFMESESKGRFLNQNIKGKYAYERLPDEEQPEGQESQAS
jgi:hypothetical protein